jgi:hypothetical protein
MPIFGIFLLRKTLIHEAIVLKYVREVMSIFGTLFLSLKDIVHERFPQDCLALLQALLSIDP